VTIRGVLESVRESQSVSIDTDRSLAALTVRPEADPESPITVGLWGKWASEAEHAVTGMNVTITDTQPSELDSCAVETTEESFLVLQPDYLVDVTDLRNWVQCPRLYYLNKLRGVPLAYPVTKGTIVHDVFGDLLRGRDLETSIDERVDAAGLELGLLGKNPDEVREEVRQNAAAIEGWLEQGLLTEEDEWRSEYTLLSPTFGIKGRADALRRGMPVELKTGKNTSRSPRFHDKLQAACYALLLSDHGVAPDTGTLLYTKNAAVDRAEESGDLSPAKEFGIGQGLLEFVVRTRNELVSAEFEKRVPTGYEGNAVCNQCFEEDTCLVVSGKLDQESKAGSIGRALPEAERAYFETQYERIEAERRAVHEEYAKLWRQSPEQRQDDGRALIDLEPRTQKQTDQNRWRLSADRPEPIASKFRDGDTVLASDGDPIMGESELARIESCSATELVVTADEPLELSRIDVYPSERSVDRMLTSLSDSLLTQPTRRKDVLFGRETPTFDEPGVEFERANDAQTRALNRALGAAEFGLVHGPPGTGKTYVIARLVCELVARGERVLLSAFTNRAVDNALEALEDAGYSDIVRIGTRRGVRADMLEYRLDGDTTPAEQANRLEAASVVAATTASCASGPLTEASFDVAVVDEASQLTEPDTLSAINRAERFVLVGDHYQLPPVVRADELGTSLFERLIDEHPEAAVLLDRQYRMAQRIQAFASREFYDGALRPANSDVAVQTLADLGVERDALPPTCREPVSFVHVEGDEEPYTDAVEAERVAELVTGFGEAGVSLGAIGVIVPFRAQVAEVSRRVPDSVTVDTVDRFQGSSKEVILVSFVASGTLSGPIFEDHRRLNVALTRARKSLVLVGDESALESKPLYARMVEWAT